MSDDSTPTIGMSDIANALQENGRLRARIAQLERERGTVPLHVQADFDQAINYVERERDDARRAVKALRGLLRESADNWAGDFRYRIDVALAEADAIPEPDATPTTEPR